MSLELGWILEESIPSTNGMSLLTDLSEME